MTMQRWNGVSWFDLTIAKRWNGTAWFDLTLAKRWNGVSWIDIPLPSGPPPGSLIATVAPGAANGSVVQDSGPTFKTVTSNSVTVTVVGGTGPYTHKWTKNTGSSAVQVTSPTSATTTFFASVPKNGSYTASMKDTITDSLGATTTVILPTVLLEYETDI